MTTTETLSLVRRVPVALLDEHPGNIRSAYDDAAIGELAESIASVGLINPITVVPNGDRFTVVAGHRRLRAVRRLGLDDVQIILSEAGDLQSATTMMLVENLQRADISVADEARGYLRLATEFKMKPKQLAKAVGRSVAHINDRLAILTLPDDVQAMVGVSLPVTTAVQITKITDDKVRKELVKSAEKGRIQDWQLTNALRSQRHKEEAVLLEKELTRLGITVLPHVKDSGVAWSHLERVTEYNFETVRTYVPQTDHVVVGSGPLVWVYRILSDEEAAERQAARSSGLKPGEERTPWHDWSDACDAFDELVHQYEQDKLAQWGVLLKSMTRNQLQTCVIEFVLADTANNQAPGYGYSPDVEVCAILGLDGDESVANRVHRYMTDMTTTFHVYIARKILRKKTGDCPVLVTAFEEHCERVGLRPPVEPDNVKIEPWQDADGNWITDRSNPEDAVSPDDHLESQYEDLTHVEDDDNWDDDESDYDFEYEGEPTVDYD